MRHGPILALLLPAMLAASPALADFVKGPYLQRVTPTSIVVCWQSASASQGVVEFGPSPALGSSVTTAGSSTFHQVELSGLVPGTYFHYQVTADGGTSTPATFRTAVQPEQPFAFVVVGDTRTDTDEHQAVVDRVLATVGAPDLYLNTGDLVEDGGDAGQWDDFFSIERALMSASALYPVAGNHDDVANDSIYVQLFDLPNSTAATENWYAFTYGNTRFVVLDTNEPFDEASDQHAWLEAELAATAGDPAIRNRVVAMHQPAYSSGGHGVIDGEDWQEVRDHLVPLFVTWDVDLVVSGHDHHYERADPALTDGVQFIVSGGGGAPGNLEDFVEGIGGLLGNLIGMPEEMTVGEYLDENPLLMLAANLAGYGAEYAEGGGGWWRVQAQVIKHFLFVEVAGDYMAGTVFDSAGNEIDAWSIGTWDGDEVDDDGDGFTEDEGDCDDADAAVRPLADDPCDGVDNDCDGADEGCGDDDSGDDDSGGAGDDDSGGAGDDDSADPDDDAGDDDVVAQTPPADGCSCAAAGRSASGGLLLVAGCGLAMLGARRRGGATPPVRRRHAGLPECGTSPIRSCGRGKRDRRRRFSSDQARRRHPQA